MATGLSIINICKLETTEPRIIKKYPPQVYNMYRDQILKKIPKTIIGEWSAWNPWTPCSRSCGGGITQQIRHCINRPADSRFIRRQRRRRQNGREASGCVGLYKRIHLCNSQECPAGQDFRYEQCAAFNSRTFKGKKYVWEPFHKANDECALNCRPVGMSFYATLNKAVIDGTSCNYPMLSTGRMAPRGTKGVCVEGFCKSLNSYGVVGGVDENQEECAACMKGSCRSINGIYTRPDLPPGYSLVAQIPRGACRILVQQLKHTRNYLALKNTNGSFIINGDWKFSNSRIVEGAGTKFTYIKQDGNSLETISTPGPLSNAIDIMIVNYQANPGIKYGYSLPVGEDKPSIAPPLLRKPPDEQPTIVTRRLDPTYFNSTFTQKDEAIRPHHYPHRRTRLRRKYFRWKITGLTACSKSCGGGIQTHVKTCVREIPSQTAIPVNDKRCAHVEPPVIRPIRCNIENCPPSWDGYWGECSASCGDGVQQFKYQCKQDLTNSGSIIVDEEQCSKPRPTSLTRTCRISSCEAVIDNELSPDTSLKSHDWVTGPWTPCSATCGTGYKTRSVSCPSNQCLPENRPKHAEYCDLLPCSTTQQPLSNTPSPWLLTEWSQCSEACGTGVQSRLTICPHNKCDHSTKPETSRACSSDKECGGQWFVGPWGQCLDSCSGPSKQKREVMCIAKIRGQSHITNDMTCPAHLKPDDERPCEGKCPPHWFISDWDECGGACPHGIQKRSIHCLEVDGKQSNDCPKDDMPAVRRSCVCSRNDDQRDKYKPAQDEPADRTCVDRIRKCKLAVQARLCHYPYYINHCCESCRRAQLQDDLE